MRLHDQRACSWLFRRPMQLSRCPLSLRPRSGEQVPSLTARIARASNPGGTTAMWVRDRLDGLWCDEDFAGWYPRDGRPGLSPAQLPLSACCSSCSACRTVRQRKQSAAAYIMDGTLVPTRDRSISASSKNYRYSTSLQVVIDANSRRHRSSAARQSQRL